MQVFLLCGIETLTSNNHCHTGLPCCFPFLLLCLPLLAVHTAHWTWQGKQGPYFRKLVLLYRKVCIHTNDFANQKLSGFTKEMGTPKLRKACEMSKLNVLGRTCLLLILSLITAELSGFQIWLCPSAEAIT